MQRLTDLPNIGPVVEAQLNEVGIYTKKDLENIGSTEAWLKILAIALIQVYTIWHFIKKVI